jgi:hypothetical protein
MPLSVKLLALSQSSQRNISGFIKTKGKKHFLVTESNSPTVTIIDIDNSEGKQYLSNLESTNTHIITLSLSESPNTSSNIVHIKKPITGVELLRAAEKIRQSSNVSKIEYKNIIETNIEDTELYDPSYFLQGMLRKAIQLSEKESTPTLITFQKYYIEIDATEKKAKFNFPKKRLRNVCQFPLNNNLCSISKNLMPLSDIESSSISLTELSWSIAVLSSRGRLPRNVNSKALYKLRAWPNLTRWEISDNALKIASLWSQKENTIAGITQQLSVSAACVHSFITAALDSNLAVISNETSEILSFPPKKEHTPLFKKLLNRLKRA